MNHYETLEVSPQASPEDIRAAYRSLMQRLHPDKNPGNAGLAARAACVAQAYDLLSDPARRSQYDLSLRAAITSIPPITSIAPKAKAARAAPRRAGWSWITWVLLSVAVLAGVGVGVSKRRVADPALELASIRRVIDSGQTAEARRRELFARKLALLEQHPALERDELAVKSEEMAARTFALLDSPLTIHIAASAASGIAADMELTIPSATVLVGSFDASSLVPHSERHRERLIRDVAVRLSSENASRLTGPGGELRLKSVLRESISASLGITPGGDYPSTYFESPGSYGVVDVLLPERFSLVQRNALR